MRLVKSVVRAALNNVKDVLYAKLESVRFSLSNFPNTTFYDVCVIGSGPAGCVLANELFAAGLTVCVLESGMVHPSDWADSLKQVDWQGLEIKNYSRERIIGGTSATWAGLSSPLDKIDFEHRPQLDGLGWPISLQTLEPFYKDASVKYRFPHRELFSSAVWNHIKSKSCIDPSLPSFSEKVFLGQFEPQRFGTEFTKVYDTFKCDLVTDATVVRLEGDQETSQTHTAVVRNRQKTLEVRSRLFVLAANGIENSRLLLHSTFSCRGGLGNENDVVGRYFMNHPKNYFGWIQLHKKIKKLPACFGFLENGIAGYFGFRLCEEIQMREQVLNSYLRFEPMYSWSSGPGVDALLYFVKQSKALTNLFAKTRSNRLTELRSYAETGDDTDLSHGKRSFSKSTSQLYNLIANSPEISKYLFFRLVDRKSPSVRWIRLRNFMEMEPCVSNRVVLSDYRDQFGNQLPLVQSSPTELDKRTMTVLHRLFQSDLCQAGWGTAKNMLTRDETPWPISADASHHLGTTRMGLNTKTSVVNEDCKIHSSPNTFVAGGSVFSTSGNANPTYTVAALSIRLAQHLAGIVKSQKIVISESSVTRESN